MAQLPMLDSQAGAHISINEFLKDPLLVQATLLQMTKQGWLADSLLRNAGITPAGVIRYRESSPLYANTDAQTRAEGAEVPLAETTEGESRVSFVEEKALGAMITDEMVRRQNVDHLQRQLIRIRNTMFRSFDNMFVKMTVNHPQVQRVAVAKPWSDPDATIREDIYEAIRLIEEATAADEVGGADIDSEFEFEADTLTISRGTRADFLGNEKFNKVYEQGDLVRENMLYTGKLPRQILNLDTAVAKRLPPGVAIVAQRKVCGFIADELPFHVTPTYRVEERKLSRADVQRASGMGLDQPLAMVVLEGV